MLELTALEKSYGGFAFGPVDLAVGDEVLSVLGPSGSGKTTLLSLVAGIVDPDSGSVSLGGRRLDDVPLQRRDAGLVFQDGALFPHMTARENVAYAAERPERVDELASLLEISDVLDRRPPTLSGGERQRVALARTLAADPDVLLLDEPLSSLDAPIRRRLRGALHDLFQSLDIPVVYVTHDQRTATAVGDRLAIVRDGAVEQVGEPTAVIDRPATRFVARFTGNENLLDATVTEGGENAVLRVGGLAFQTTATAEPGADVTLCVHPSRVQVEPPDTEAPNSSNSPNRFEGIVERWLHEGTEVWTEIRIGGGVTLTATVSPSRFDGLETGSRVRVTVLPEAIHLLP